MKISYAITVYDELKEIKKLIPYLVKHKRKEDEIVVLMDDRGPDEIWDFLLNFKKKLVIIERLKFPHHFAEWKNTLTELCDGDYIFQIDADEIPHKNLIKILPGVFETNPHVDAFIVPRINTVKGITKKHIKKWGWQLNGSKWVNFPDYQWRIYKNNNIIKWVNKVHEKLKGFHNFSEMPPLEEYCLYHHKDIKRQEKQNDYYNTL